MIKKTSPNRNKVARRILLSFVVASLIPVLVLGVLSFHQVSQQLYQQSYDVLQKSSKDYGLRLIDRLVLAESALRLLANRIERSNRGLRDQNLFRDQKIQKQFNDLAIITGTGQRASLLGDTRMVPYLNKEEIEAVRSGLTLIKPVDSNELGVKQIWIALNFNEKTPDAGILMAELHPEALWEVDNMGINQLLVMTDVGESWFSSLPNKSLPNQLLTELLDKYSGSFNQNIGDNIYLGGFWQAPIGNMFASPDLIIVHAQPKSIALSAIDYFTKVYPPVILLTVLIVAFLSTKLIAKYLSPLSALKKATERIADGQFDYQVEVHSKDEFEALADSFNEMTRRLRSQFEIQSTMAEIDRQILSVLNADEIVETALNRLPGILFSDLISIAKFDPEKQLIVAVHTRRDEQHFDLEEQSIAITDEDLAELQQSQGSVLEINERRLLPVYLNILNLTGNWFFLVIPVVVNGQVSASISFAYQQPKVIGNELKAIARSFGDRIAVALSNAAWEEKLFQQAHFDGLTGLPNRLVLNERLQQEIARADRDSKQLAVFFLDLDRFKNVNDSLGHSAGDELLVKVANHLSNSIRTTDLVVRMSGDEFVVLITNIDNPDLINMIADKVLKAVDTTSVVAEQSVKSTASMGIAMYPTDAETPEDLLKFADSAMYYAKNDGRATFRFYSAEMTEKALENIKLEHDLREAISKGEIVVYYQPKFDSNKKIIGAEALIRWNHSEFGMISPAKFIPIAEQTMLIVEIGRWVLEQTCELIKSFTNLGIEPVPISVNISGVEFDRPDIVPNVAEILKRTRVNPSFIELELTENVAIGNREACIERMHQLKALGLRLAMDDFGTGFSSLSYLQDLPLDVLKIDQHFIRELETGINSQAIVRAILALADGLHMQVIAEGVETESQLTFLLDHQCKFFQGFLFSRPIPSNEFVKLLLGKEQNTIPT
ncbi:MAG: EAL domain-containing protein [Methylophaga sp.]|uniref:EAL domain-containing protein n=1 Tax=Methylophaga sp. TaxID=2024840 RepID=UPI00299E68D1|nr:EAL domain-containing protein [Methylophaga sp.]MDX1749768.1 EAL domain-containing protein [Methylophaga sp.]